MDGDWDWLRQFGAVALVMGLLAAAMWALRQAGWFNAGITAGPGTSANGPSKRPVGRIGAALRGVLAGRARRRYFTQENGNLQLPKITSMDRLALTPQHFLHVVRVGQRDLLVATHPQGCALVADLGNAADSGKAASDLGVAGEILGEGASPAAEPSRSAAQPRVGIHA